MSRSLNQLCDTMQALEDTYRSTLPPLHRWNPECNGDLDMRIDREGNWFYQGGKIERHALVKMFSSILRREGDDYYLVTPVEKWRIQVAIAPFVIVECKCIDVDEGLAYAMTTNVGAEFLLGEGHPLWVASSGGELLPYVMVRDNLPGVLSRNVYYQLAEFAVERNGRFFIETAGGSFPLG